MSESNPAGRLSWPLVIVSSLLAGVLLGLAGPPLTWVPLLLVALVPFLAVVTSPRVTLLQAVAASVLVGLGQNLTLALLLQFPLSFALALVVFLGVTWALPGLLMRPLARRLPGPLLVVALPAALVVWDVLAVTVVPVFGTAQSFSRCVVEWPRCASLAALGGFGMVTFVLAVPQVALVVAVRQRTRWRSALATGIVALVLWGAAGGWIAGRAAIEPEGSIRVAAAGWTYEQMGNPWSTAAPSRQLQRVLAPHVQQAARDGAELVVAPEAAFFVPATEREAFLAQAAALARQHGVTLVIGWFDGEADENHATILDPRGVQQADYLKTHLIPTMEDYVAGDGELVDVALPAGWSMGAMICQDDNFRDLGRAYGRAGTPLVAVPTNDWEQVQQFHLQNSRLRAVDSGYGIVRAATNGISAIVDARGRLLASMDHHADGPGVIVADLPVYAGGTPYAHAGEWFAGACLLVLAGCGIGLRYRTAAASRR